ncbi:hypothetical protein [Paraburkholderia sp. WC7.3d]|uniref:hypothetical protein n=1 Tax=Paraburkholderia TaxID=1822464 RepID=UPI003D1919A5
MAGAWTVSGLGVRRFCREQGPAVSTFVYGARRGIGPYREKSGGRLPESPVQ